jgi:hypothetical protein
MGDSIMPLQINGATSGSATIQSTDTYTNTLTLPSGTGTLLSTANPQSGGVIQVVQGNLNTEFTTTSNSFVSTGLSATITPKFSTSKIAIFVSGNGYTLQSQNAAVYTLYKNNTTNLSPGSGQNTFQEIYVQASYLYTSVNFNYIDSPATTSATTYTVYMSSGNGYTTKFNVNGQASTIILMEIAA